MKRQRYILVGEVDVVLEVGLVAHARVLGVELDTAAAGVLAALVVDLCTVCVRVAREVGLAFALQAYTTRVRKMFRA